MCTTFRWSAARRASKKVIASVTIDRMKTLLLALIRFFFFCISVDGSRLIDRRQRSSIFSTDYTAIVLICKILKKKIKKKVTYSITQLDTQNELNH